jgi:hypothetical protein
VELALRWFQLAVVWNFGEPEKAAKDPHLAGLRKDPRFNLLLGQLRESLLVLEEEDRKRGRGLLVDDAESDSGSAAPGGGTDPDGHDIVAVAMPEGHIARGEMCLCLAWLGTLYANMFVSQRHSALEPPSSSANFLWMMTLLALAGVAQMFAGNVTCKACVNARLPLPLLSTACVMVEVCLLLNLIRDISVALYVEQLGWPSIFRNWGGSTRSLGQKRTT